MAAMSCRRLLPLTLPPPLMSPPTARLLLLSLSSVSATSPAAVFSNPERQARMSWRRLLSSPSSSTTGVSSCSSDLCYQTLALRMPSSVVRRALVARGGQKLIGQVREEAFTELWKSRSSSLNCPRVFHSGFFQTTGRSKTERFGCLAAGGSKRGGFVMSSVLKDTKPAEEGISGKGDNLTLVTFQTKDGQSAVGAVRGDVLWSLQDMLNSSDGKPLPQISDMQSVIINWSDLKDRLIAEGNGMKLNEFKLLAPLPRPTGVIMCIGKNYLDHVKEVDTWKSAPGISKPEAPQHPIVFTKAPQSVIGPGAAIKYPHGVSSAVDYEAELGVIIGKAGQNIKREDAMSHIFGYTIINDVTARDLQKRHQQWFIGKSCDTFCPMGPGIVLASEIDGNNLQIQCWINGELRQNGRTSNMIFGIPQLIEVISSTITIQPGDIIATGTPSGVGSGFNPPRHLVPGDKIKIYIEGIGELCNTVE